MAKSSPEGPNRRGTPVKTYATRVFQESTVGTVSVIASTSSKRRQFFKAFVLIVCLIGFFYQSIKFLTVVFTFPTDVNIDIIRPNIFNSPAYTFCDNNGIKRSLFCSKYPEYCEKPDEELCTDFPLYCNENTTLVPKEEYYMVEKILTREQFDQVSGDLEDLLVANELSQENPEGPYIRLRDMEEFSWMSCYSLNGRVNNSLYPLQTEKSPLLKKPIDSLVFHVDEEMFIPGYWPGILFAIHSPFEAVNPFETGIFMKPGKMYIIHVSMDEERLLQKPYQTDCINYTAEWEANGRKGPRTQEMCRHECLIDVSMKCFNCVLPLLLYPAEQRMCTYDDTEKVMCSNTEKDEEECYIGCKDSCQRTKYNYVVQERPVVKTNLENYPLESLNSIIIVKVYLDEDEIIVLKHSPKYMVVEVFSTIGGFIGGWLGISLLEVTDIFEGFVRITRYSLKRR